MGFAINHAIQSGVRRRQQNLLAGGTLEASLVIALDKEGMRSWPSTRLLSVDPLDMQCDCISSGSWLKKTG